MPDAPLALTALGERLAVCRFDPWAEIPAWATATTFCSVTRTPDELSVVCPEGRVPAEVKCERGWRAIKLEGPLDLSLVGVLVSVAAPLAEAGVGIFPIATYDTDKTKVAHVSGCSYPCATFVFYVLLKEPYLDAAVAALSGSGHDVRVDGPPPRLRSIVDEDEHFMWEMLAEAAHEPDVRDVMENPDVAKYAEGWGREGDLGFVAVDGEHGRPVGAAWLRSFAADNRGYGYADENTPELAIAVRPGRRGTGIGTCLLARLLEAARSRHPSVSLSVRTDNPAVRPYERMGFEAVENGEAMNRVGGASITMKANLREKHR